MLFSPELERLISESAFSLEARYELLNFARLYNDDPDDDPPSRDIRDFLPDSVGER